ncbi:MAG: winged helix-turn-helix transcriptional regulator [Candidatus Peribacteraceae bacterium]|nr:winged helix-turn-helix transcriptional regulator [Candidatus Peribacteraceae bacterium]
MNIQDLEQKLKILSNARRITILKHLHKNKTATVSEISETLKINIYAISKHLRLLRTAKLVTFTRRGPYVSYRLPLKKDPLLKVVLDQI